MTVAALTPSADYLENGITTEFPLPFRFLDPGDIAASRDLAGGSSVDLVYGVDFIVTGGQTDAGGTLIVTKPAAAPTVLHAWRATPRSQTADYTTGDRFPAESHEAALDKARLIDQEQDVELGRALKAPIGELGVDLPSIANRSNKALFFDGSGRAAPISIDDFSAPARGAASRAESAALAAEAANNYRKTIAEALAAFPVGVAFVSPQITAENPDGEDRRYIRIASAPGYELTADQPAAKKYVDYVSGKLPSVTDYPWRAKMDGSDNTAATLAFMTYLEANNLMGFIPPGVLNLATWPKREFSAVRLRGFGSSVTKIKGPRIIGRHFAEIATSGVVDIEGIGFSDFDSAFYSEKAVASVRIDKCGGTALASYLYKQADVSYYPSSGVAQFEFTGNRIDTCGGCMVHGAVGRAVVTGNQLTNVRRDRTIWVGANPLYQTFGLSIGDTNNYANTIAQRLVTSIAIIGNSIDGMYNETPASSFNTTNAIQATGFNVTIASNSIIGMDALDLFNCEPIYLKSQNYTVIGNPIKNCKTTSAYIAVKGTLDNSGPRQKNSIIAQNPMSSDGTAVCAITVFAGGYLDIMDNQMEGFSQEAVRLFGDPYMLNVVRNSILGGGTGAIVVNCGSAINCRIEDNTIDELIATTGNLRPISIVANNRQISRIVVDTQGDGYQAPYVNSSGNVIIPTTVTITTTGGGSATAQPTVVNGKVVAIQVNSSNAAFATGDVTTVTINGPGSGATAHVVLTTGEVREVSIKNNKTRWSPRSTHSLAVGIFIQSDSQLTPSVVNVATNDNSFVADGQANAPVIQGINFYSPSAGKWLSSCSVDGLRMTVPDITKLRPVTFNGSVDLAGQGAMYDDLSVVRTRVNGRHQRVLTKFQSDERSVTAVVKLAGLPVGSHLIGYIPYSVLLTQVLAFTSTAPTSGSSTATIGVSVGTTALFNVLAGTVVTAFSANAFMACIPDGTAANAKRAFAVAGLVPVYIEVGVQALTGGTLELVMSTEALAT